MKTYLILISIASAFHLLESYVSAQEPIPLPRAHSHNDYLRARPLLDALELGFCSVEADIHLVNGELLVAHDRDKVKPGETLQKLYLDPLLERVHKNGGRVYPNGPEFTLLVDFKSGGIETYKKLRAALKNYKKMLTRYTDTSTKPKAVRIIVSGSYTQTAITADSPRWVAIDGRPPDLKGPANPHLMPWISASWDSVFKWNGEGVMPESERQQLLEMVAKAHAKGQQIRFWALPEKPNVWPEIYAAGVDILNTDDLPALRDFLLKQMENEKK